MQTKLFKRIVPFIGAFILFLGMAACIDRSQEAKDTARIREIMEKEAAEKEKLAADSSATLKRMRENFAKAASAPASK